MYLLVICSGRIKFYLCWLVSEKKHLQFDFQRFFTLNPRLAGEAGLKGKR
jgi:hypothetical protein